MPGYIRQTNPRVTMPRGFLLLKAENGLLLMEEMMANRFTMLPDALVDALVRGRLSGSQIRVVMAVARLTYGYSRPRWVISTRMFRRVTGLALQTIHDVLETLVNMRVLVRELAGRSFTYSINDPSMWDESVLPPLPKAPGTRDPDDQELLNNNRQESLNDRRQAPLNDRRQGPLNDDDQQSLNTYTDNSIDKSIDNTRESTISPGVRHLSNLWIHYYPLERRGRTVCEEMLLNLMQQGYGGDEIEAAILDAVKEKRRRLNPWDLKRRLEKGEQSDDETNRKSNSKDTGNEGEGVSRLFKYLNDLSCERPAPGAPKV